MSSSKLDLKAPWEIVKERLKESNTKLTDEDLDYEPGKEDELLQHLQQKLNKSKEDVKNLVESISSNTESAG